MENIDYSQYTILVVDDVVLNLVLVEKMLKRYNFNILKATSGTEALETVAANKPSLMLLDLMMPNMDGFEVLERLRNNPDSADIPVIILSALNSESDIEKGMKCGANDYITKPIIMTRLIGAIQKQLIGE